MKFRIALGVIGVGLIGYGAVRIFANSPGTNPMGLGQWLAGAVIVHDGIFVPIVSVIGFVLAKIVRPRARRYLQGALIVAGVLTLIALPEIHLEGTQDPAKAWLRQDYEKNLHVLWVIVAVAGTLSYVFAVVCGRAREHRRSHGGLGPLDSVRDRID